MSPGGSSMSPGGTASPGRSNKLDGQEFRAGVAMKLVQHDATEQDSDIMERLPIKEVPLNAVTDGIALVSLGCSCAPKLSFKEIGRGAETLPFDWARTSLKGILHFLATDFEGFFDTGPKLELTDQSGCLWTCYRSRSHSFWHDDPTQESMRERYQRRIDRFLGFEAQSRVVLFVRSVASTGEILGTEQLLQALIAKFGHQAKLLLIIDYQGSRAIGPVKVDGTSNLLLWYFDTNSPDVSRTGPYAGLLPVALQWASGRPIHMHRVPGMKAASDMAIPSNWGCYGADGHPAFDEPLPVQTVGGVLG